jgi:phosphatidylglycerophosphate synthase
MGVVQPLVQLLVALLKRLGVNPLPVVAFHSLIGFFAAWLIGSSSPMLWLYAALLLQLKTVLDNADGDLARATNQVTQTGRYFDTGMDFLVNIALFVALATHGPALLSLLAFVLLTLLLSLDFNMERLYKARRSETTEAAEIPEGAPKLLFRLFQSLYCWVFAPQDRGLEHLDHALGRLSGVRENSNEKRAWNDLFSTASVVNLGLSSQYLVLGLCLFWGQPFWYVYAIFLMALYVLAVQLLRVLRYRRAARALRRSL